MNLLNLPPRLITQRQMAQIGRALSSGVNHLTKYQAIIGKEMQRINKSAKALGINFDFVQEEVAKALSEISDAQCLLGAISLSGGVPSFGVWRDTSAERPERGSRVLVADIQDGSVREANYCVPGKRNGFYVKQYTGEVVETRVDYWMPLPAWPKPNGEIPGDVATTATPDALLALRDLVAYLDNEPSLEPDSRVDRARALVAGLTAAGALPPGGEA